jgi:phosphoribosylaminoimidazolecarboxamide formyltransferase/IMP cyclohydrolase
MAPKDLKAAYRSIHQDFFPKNMEISFYDDNSRQTLFYEKVSWTIEGEEKGLRYGENPGQDAALYKMVNGNLCLGDVACIGPGHELVSGVELIKSGKHPGKTNLTDADAALNILRYLMETPAVVIVKHNNPCGVAISDTPWPQPITKP